MKTFKMEQTNKGLVSTYKLIDGKCANRYAKDCAIIKRFIRQTTIPGSESDKRSIRYQSYFVELLLIIISILFLISDKSITDEYYDTVLEIASDIRNSRIECFTRIARDYIQDLANSQINIDLLNIFHKCSI